MTAFEIYQRLATRFSVDRGFVFEREIELRGANHYNRADAIALGFWKRSGLMQATGFEVKANRQDWLRELDKPEKQQLLLEQCNQFYLVVTDRSIVNDFELPKGWGLMVPSGKRLRIVMRSDTNTNAQLSPKTLAKLIERAYLKSPAREKLRAVRQAALEEGREREMKRQRQHDDGDRLKQQVEAFEKASGLKISAYTDGHQLGDLVTVARLLTGKWGGIEALLANLERQAEHTKEFTNQTRKALTELLKGKGIE